MNCRDVREVADSFLCDELLTETNHEILRHLETCPSCRGDIEGRRRLRGALQAAFDGAPDLQPRPEFRSELRARLLEAAAEEHSRPRFSRGWLALAATLVLAAGLVVTLMVPEIFDRGPELASDAMSDHRNCALKFRLVRRPIPLEEAAQQFDAAYRVLVTSPPDDVATPIGAAHVLERHSCQYDERRFGHVVMKYRGRVVSLLLTANDGAADAAGGVDDIPHVIGRALDGLSVVSVNGRGHAVMLVSDLDNADLVQLSRLVSVPLVQQLDARARSPVLGSWLAAIWPISPPME
jgi:hypothetical protein